MNEDLNQNIWHEQFRVRSSEVDERGLTTPAALLNMFQEAATGHAVSLGVGGDDIGGTKLAWVLARLQVQFSSTTGWRETILVETWPSGLDRLRAYRDFILRNTQKSRVAAGISTWLLIDPQNRRPVRMPSEIAKIETPGVDRAIAARDLEEPSMDSVAVSGSRIARNSDIDINRHVNNVRYIEWLIDEMPDEVYNNYRLRDLDVWFKAESVTGDELQMLTRYEPAKKQGFAVDTTITRAADERVVVTARSIWG